MLWHRSWFHKFIVLLLWIPKDICPDNSFPTTKCSKIKIPVFYRTKNKIRSKHLKNNWKKYHLKRKLDLYVYIYIFVHEITVFMFSIYIYRVCRHTCVDQCKGDGLISSYRDVLFSCKNSKIKPLYTYHLNTFGCHLINKHKDEEEYTRNISLYKALKHGGSSNCKNWIQITHFSLQSLSLDKEDNNKKCWGKYF